MSDITGKSIDEAVEGFQAQAVSEAEKNRMRALGLEKLNAKKSEVDAKAASTIVDLRTRVGWDIYGLNGEAPNITLGKAEIDGMGPVRRVGRLHYVRESPYIHYVVVQIGLILPELTGPNVYHNFHGKAAQAREPWGPDEDGIEEMSLSTAGIDTGMDPDVQKWLELNQMAGAINTILAAADDPDLNPMTAPADAVSS